MNGTKYTHEELVARARKRANEENLHSFQVERRRLYLVKSRKLRPGTYHMVRVHRSGQVTCDCPGWERWTVCAHQQTVVKRLEREAARRAWYRDQYLQADLLGEEPEQDAPENATPDLQAA
ncbi:MAG: hypothetical protein M3506_05555 [Chloroflexota bacterium]|nr:hypothetical protein [Chloroflexota bacterium]